MTTTTEKLTEIMVGIGEIKTDVKHIIKRVDRINGQVESVTLQSLENKTKLKDHCLETDRNEKRLYKNIAIICTICSLLVGVASFVAAHVIK